MNTPTDEQLDELWDEIGGYYNLYPEVRNTIREALNRWGNVEIEKMAEKISNSDSDRAKSFLGYGGTESIV